MSSGVCKPLKHLSTWILIFPNYQCDPTGTTNIGPSKVGGLCVHQPNECQPENSYEGTLTS